MVRSNGQHSLSTRCSVVAALMIKRGGSLDNAGGERTCCLNRLNSNDAYFHTDGAVHHRAHAILINSALCCIITSYLSHTLICPSTTTSRCRYRWRLAQGVSIRPACAQSVDRGGRAARGETAPAAPIKSTNTNRQSSCKDHRTLTQTPHQHSPTPCSTLHPFTTQCRHRHHSHHQPATLHSKPPLSSPTNSHFHHDHPVYHAAHSVSYSFSAQSSRSVSHACAYGTSATPHNSVLSPH